MGTVATTATVRAAVAEAVTTMGVALVVLTLTIRTFRWTHGPWERGHGTMEPWHICRCVCVCGGQRVSPAKTQRQASGMRSPGPIDTMFKRGPEGGGQHAQKNVLHRTRPFRLWQSWHGSWMGDALGDCGRGASNPLKSTSNMSTILGFWMMAGLAVGWPR